MTFHRKEPLHGKEAMSSSFASNHSFHFNHITPFLQVLKGGFILAEDCVFILLIYMLFCFSWILQVWEIERRTADLLLHVQHVL